jgi:hypothetical protein
LVEPVVIGPLRREFEAMQAKVVAIGPHRPVTKRTPADKNPRKAFAAFLDRVRSVTVLDPACGSGNFLYIALQQLKDLEREAIIWGSHTLRTPMEFPQVGPEAVKGIELNPYAAEIARVVIWIGEIQWMLNNGFAYRRNPILRPLNAIENRDALLEWTDAEHPVEADWPDATFVVGNQPFMGGKLMRTYLGDAYVEQLFRVIDGRVPRDADFVTYGHEKALLVAGQDVLVDAFLPGDVVVGLWRVDKSCRRGDDSQKVATGHDAARPRRTHSDTLGNLLVEASSARYVPRLSRAAGRCPRCSAATTPRWSRCQPPRWLSWR